MSKMKVSIEYTSEAQGTWRIPEYGRNSFGFDRSGMLTSMSKFDNVSLDPSRIELIKLPKRSKQKSRYLPIINPGRKVSAGEVEVRLTSKDSPLLMIDTSGGVLPVIDTPYTPLDVIALDLNVLARIVKLSKKPLGGIAPGCMIDPIPAFIETVQALNYSEAETTEYISKQRKLLRDLGYQVPTLDDFNYGLELIEQTRSNFIYPIVEGNVVALGSLMRLYVQFKQRSRSDEDFLNQFHDAVSVIDRSCVCPVLRTVLLCACCDCFFLTPGTAESHLLNSLFERKDLRSDVSAYNILRDFNHIKYLTYMGCMSSSSGLRYLFATEDINLAKLASIMRLSGDFLRGDYVSVFKHNYGVHPGSIMDRYNWLLMDKFRFRDTIGGDLTVRMSVDDFLALNTEPNSCRDETDV